ncbi:flagellar assembly protein FliX [Kordiimonas lipolytica]|uniref:Flagellar assembly protein FliX n=1 Tax=Kordiimonas lipolytica TaxID=1662421 RepID=A0ABV8UG96_9PROT|nr:flagellar assembly protein FliX [Kordiimonas lipolytica]
MKISGSGSVQSKTVKKTSRKGASGGSAFASELSGTRESSASGAASGAGAAGPIASLDAVIALQGVPDATERRSKGLKRAEEMLDLLEEVRKGILLGAIPAPKLRGLADMARNQRGKTDDKKLDEILADIELRAEVELAKLGV